VPTWDVICESLHVIATEDHPRMFELEHEPKELEPGQVRLGSQLRNARASLERVLALRFANLYWDNDRSTLGIAPFMQFVTAMMELGANKKLPDGQTRAPLFASSFVQFGET